MLTALLSQIGLTSILMGHGSVGIIVLVGGGSAAIALAKKLLDKSLTPAEASLSIKLAMAHNAAEVISLTTKDSELMQINLSTYLYERVGQFFRVWAFCDWNSHCNGLRTALASRCRSVLADVGLHDVQLLWFCRGVPRW